MQKHKYFSLIIVSTFLIAISLPLIGSFMQDDRGLSYQEKRKLQQLPQLPHQLEELDEYITAFEKYFNDQFGFRDFFLSSYSHIKGLIGDRDISRNAENVGTANVLEGKDGWFFLNRKWDGDPVADYRNLDLYSEGKLLLATLLFAARTHWLKSQGVEYVFFFAPNKHTIYSEYLPDYIRKEGDISALDQLDDALRRHTDVNFVDLRPTLLQSKDEAVKYWKDSKEEAALYYKMDSHWNSGGADIAQFAIAERISHLFPGRIIPAKRPLEDFIIRRFVGDITLIMGGNEKEAYGPALMQGTCTPLSFMDYLQRHHVTECPRGQLDAIVFNDSFLPPLKPYFSDYFRRTVYRWEQMQEAVVAREMQVRKPDIVIEQRAERFLPFYPRADYAFYEGFWEKHWSKWKLVFALDLEKAAEGAYRNSNLEMQFRKERGDLLLKATSDDPMLYLPKMEMQPDTLYLGRAVLESEHDTELQIFYSVAGAEEQFPSDESHISFSLQKGMNVLYMPLFSMNMAGRIRIDPARKPGKYELQELQVRELGWVDLR